jgi:hypothetical protein
VTQRLVTLSLSKGGGGTENLTLLPYERSRRYYIGGFFCSYVMIFLRPARFSNGCLSLQDRLARVGFEAGGLAEGIDFVEALPG